MAILGHAASAEDGSGFGRPGDQTGREVRMETLGADGNNWQYIYRYFGPNQESIRYNTAEAMRQLCMNPMGGYSRETYLGWGLYYSRYGFWTAITDFGDIRLIDKPFNCDCSSAVAGCMRIAGVQGAVREMVTATEDQILTSLGYKKIPYKKEDTLKGDILWRPGHTGIVVEGWEGAVPEPTPKYVGRITKFTPVFRTPNSAYENILPEHPYLGVDNLVDVCDETEGFYYVRIIDKYGYVVRDSLTKYEEPKEIKIGDKVKFTGKRLYTSAAGSKYVEVPEFSGTINDIADGKKHPYYVYSKKFDGWCNKTDVSK